MPVQHNSLTGSDLHEPRGIANAGTNTYYKADGGGSGAWVKSYQSTTTILEDTSSLSSIAFMPFPAAVVVKKIVGVLDRTVTSSGSSLTVAIYSAADVLVGNLSFTVSGSGPGSTVTLVTDQIVVADSHLYAEISGDVSTEPAKVYLSFYSEVT